MWPWRVKIPTQNLLILLLLPMLMMRIMLATVCCRIGSWGLVIKLNFCSDFELKFKRDFEAVVWSVFAADVWLRLQSWIWILVKILKLSLVRFRFSQETDVTLRSWSQCLIEVLKLKFDQDLCMTLWYELNPRVRCAFGNVYGDISIQHLMMSRRSDLRFMFRRV